MPSKVDKIKLSRKQDRRAKFDDEQVKEIRELYAKGYTQKAIAEIYKTNQSTICYIVSDKAHQHLAEYRKINPPKRRKKAEARKYQRDLRMYKMKILHSYPKKEFNKESDCSKCKFARRLDKNTLVCDAEEYDVETLSCFVSAEPKEIEKGGAE